MRLYGLIIPIILIIALIPITTLTSAYNNVPITATIQDDKIKTENFLRITEMTKNRIETLLNNIKANSSLMANESIKAKVENLSSIFNNALKLLNESYKAYQNGDYNLSISIANEVLKILRDIHSELSDLYTPYAPGLFLVANCTLARLELLNSTLSSLNETIENASQLIKQAYDLLSQINTSLPQDEIAKRIAEANRIINEVNKMIKLQAQERTMLRINNYINNLEKKCLECGKNITETLAPIKEKLKGMKNYEDIIEKIRNLMPIIDKMKYTTNGEKYLLLNVSVSGNTIEITISNIGNYTILFPNSAYGMIIEKKVNDKWILYYAPITLQVITKLDPGDTVKMKIPIEEKIVKGPFKILLPGTYRITINGWIENTRERISVSKEFTI
jgi:phosphate uptake regulator